MQEQHVNSFDEGVGAWLRHSAKPISRRSLLGRGIQLLLGGVGLAGLGSIPLLADVPGWGRRSKGGGTGSQVVVPPLPEGFDTKCSNLHGVLCSGTCDPNAAGASDCLVSDTAHKQAAWVGCCKDSVTSMYQCYTLADVVCATRPTNWNDGSCPGNTPAGRVWFGGKQGKRSYVCTIPAAVGAQYGAASDCAANCTPKLYPNTWAC